MIPLRLFNQLSTSVIYLQSALYNGVWQIDLYFLPMYFQDVRGYSPLKNAMLMLPLLITQSAGGIVAGQITSKLARYILPPTTPFPTISRYLTSLTAYRPGPVIYGGLVLWTLGAGLKVIFSRDTPVAVYVVSLIIEGAGVGFILQPGKSLYLNDIQCSLLTSTCSSRGIASSVETGRPRRGYVNAKPNAHARVSFQSGSSNYGPIRIHEIKLVR